MKIKQIIVDVLPDNCSHCKFSGISIRNNWYCEIMHSRVIGEEPIRPSWCPIEVEEECVWSGNFVGYDENGDALFITKKTSCSDVHVQTVNIPDYKFCQNCGKRIRYTESEE